MLAAGWDAVRVGAPLAPNINHRETVFGGSASAVAILAAWGLVHFRLATSDISNRLVIRRNTMSYERPVTGFFTATASLADATEWDRFLKLLERKGRARLNVNSLLESDGERVGFLEGEFVAFTGEAF